MRRVIGPAVGSPVEIDHGDDIRRRQLASSPAFASWSAP